MPKPSTGADATRRAARTLFQIGTVTALIQLWNLFSARPLTADQTSAITVVGTLLITFMQNLLEEQGSVPEMLKGPTFDPGLNARKLNALAEATGAHQDEIERLENAMLDLRANLRLARPVSSGSSDTTYGDGWERGPENPERISTRQHEPEDTSTTTSERFRG